MIEKTVLTMVCSILLGATTIIIAQPDGYIEVPILAQRTSKITGCERNLNSPSPEILFTGHNAQACRREYDELNVDATNQTAVFWSSAGDCNMQIRAKIFRNNAEKKVAVILNNHYGGCASVGRRSGWIVFEKPPAGHSIHIEEFEADRITLSEKTTNEFIYSKPVSIKQRTSIASRQVDLKGCLPTTGQSRWVINSKNVLDAALDRNAATAFRCREILDQEHIDIEMETLISIGFATGHCQKPLDVDISLALETSSQPSENRYVVTSRYTPPVDRPCAAWVAHQYWIAVPKLEMGIRVDFEVERR